MTQFELVLDRLLQTKAKLTTAHDELRAAQAEIDRLHVQSPQFAAGDVVAMLRALADGKKIEAIKACRIITGYGLKEAKDLIEAATGPYHSAAA